jgi:hypothetical protein
MSPPRGRMPTTRTGWIAHWITLALLPLIGWAVLGVPGLWGGGWLSLVVAALTGVQRAMRRR